MIKKCFLFNVDHEHEVFDIVKNPNVVLLFTKTNDRKLRRLNSDGSIDVVSSHDIAEQYGLTDDFFTMSGSSGGGSSTGSTVGSATTVVSRVGSTIAFDRPAVYNTPESPSSGTITYDLSGAADNIEVVAYFNHGSLPAFPTGTTVIGVWQNTSVNQVRFLRSSGGTICAAVYNSNTAGYTDPVTTAYPSADFSTATTVAQAIPGMAFSLSANRRYRVHGMLSIRGAGGSGGLKFGLGYTASVTQYVALVARGASGLVYPPSEVLTNSNGYNTVGGLQYNTSTNDGWAFFDGVVKCGVSASTMSVLVGSQTSGQTVLVRDASYLEIKDIGPST